MILEKKRGIGYIKSMEQLNQYQIKSLAGICFDLAKAWFVAGIIAPFGSSQILPLNKILLLVFGIMTTLFFINIGLSLGRRVKE